MNTVMTAILGVLTGISEWFTSTFSQVSGLFYESETGLTFVGTIAVLSFGIGVALLVVNYIRRWIRG